MNKKKTGKRKNEITGKDLAQVKQRFLAKAFILIDRCQKKEKRQLLHLWDENEWKEMVYLIDTNYKDTKDENIKELKELALELVKLDICIFEFAKEYLEGEIKAAINKKGLGRKENG